MKSLAKIPEEFLKNCINDETGEPLDTDEIVNLMIQDIPDTGDYLMELIEIFFKTVAIKYIMPKVEEYAEDYFEPSARDEALADIRRETMERIKNESY